MGRRLVRGSAALAGGLGVALVLAGCGGGSTTEAAATAAAVTAGDGSQDTSGGVQDGSAAGSADGRGGVSGLIAAVTGTTMQVQSDVQTAVTWSDDTTITQEVSTDLSAVTVGSCVVVIESSADTSSDTSSGGVTSGDTAGTAGPASSVVVSEPVDGECTGFAGAGAGGMPGGQMAGAPTDGATGMPSGMPTDMPSGGPTDLPSGGSTDLPSGMPTGGSRGFGAMVAGTVTAVDDAGITVDQDGTTSTVTIDDATTYTTTQTVDSSAISVGLCVSARGESDDRGGMTATSLSLSDAVDGACTSVGGRGA
ncbi:PT domain-containing protein [Actinotalea sp. M2MS4P-6]|uniref:PT domain-containing protein n=1 Tax=Actinotalea sp. M2MS4P-6 TaxID=2983762 RepID=UPI0021E49D18|nr:PT domain-containing protein [Actinotalea sp. M2MS4P-6]MCV2394915.1 PT domain-containing protein [Actinotalea sp. M2MS4P-6]